LPITRTFTITGFAKPITVKDMRTGEDDADLATLGIISRLTAGLNSMPTDRDVIVDRNLTIAVEETTEYTRLKARSGNRLAVNFTYISADDENLAERMINGFINMYSMTPEDEHGNLIPPIKSPPQRLTFGTAENPYSVTVTSEETFTTAEWNTLVDKVVAAIMRGYNKNVGGELDNILNKDNFQTIFTPSYGVKIILSSSMEHNCEVKSTDYKTMYLKTNAIDTIDIEPAITAMINQDGNSYTSP
jgi:hypothetical protein